MNTRNPKVDGVATSVQTLLDKMKKDEPQEFRVVGTLPVPDWRGVNNHFQGIAPVNGQIKISGQISASADEAWFALFHEGSSGSPAVVDGVWETENYDHAGGIQRLGDLLPLPLEGDDKAVVAFFEGTRYLYEFSTPSGHKASSVAITNYTDSGGVEQALLFVYRYEPRSFNVYRAPADSVGGNSWVHVGSTNELDGDQYQCFGLATQANANGDQVYLLGFREDEELHLYSVDTGEHTFGHLSFVKMYDYHGSQWRYGVGLQIASPTMLRIFGCSEDPSGDRDDYDFPIYFWG